jgi:hypothetical protein
MADVKIVLSETNYSFVTGWYGVCGDNDCEAFDLRTLPSNTLFKAIQISATGTSRASFNPSYNEAIPQPFSTLECGFLYELTFKPLANTEITIPGFVWKKLATNSADRLSDKDECDQIGTLTGKPISQHGTNYSFVTGWYGVCGAAECAPFDLRTLPTNTLFKAIQISATGTSRASFNPSYAEAIPQPFSTLECGFLYELTFKPGDNTNINIPGFVWNKLSDADAGRILTDGCVTVTPTPTPEPIPTLNVISATDTTIGVDWVLGGPNQDKVFLEIATDSDFTTIIDSKILFDEIDEYVFENLTDSTDYFVRIATVNETTNALGTYVTQPAKTTIAGQKTNLTVQLSPSIKPVISWTNPGTAYDFVNVFRFDELAQVDMDFAQGSFGKISTVPFADGFTFTDESIDASDPDGTYQYKIQFNNGFAGTFSDIAQIIIDTTPAGVPSPLTQTPTNNKQPTWTWTSITDAVAYEILLDGASITETTALQYTAPELDHGPHDIQVRSRDADGNVSAYGKQNIFVDRQPPLKPVLETASDLTSNKRPTWSWNISQDVSEYGVIFDNNTEITQTTVSYTPSELSDGTYKIKVRAKDAVGNWSDYAESTVVVDITPPDVPVPTSTTPTNNDKPTWHWSPDPDATLYGIVLNDRAEVNSTDANFQSPLNLTTGHVHTLKLKVRARDSLGTWSDYGEKTVVVDLAKPAVPNPSTNTPTSNQQPTWNWQEVVSAVAYHVKFNGGSVESVGLDRSYTPDSQLGTGSYKLEVRSEDNVGNLSDWGSHTVEVDRELPAKPDPTTTTPTNNKQPTWTWPKINDAVLYGVVLNNLAESEQTELFFTPTQELAEGVNTIKVRSKDHVGLWSDYGVHPILVDTTPPSVPQPTTTTPTSNQRPAWDWVRTSDAVEYGIVFDDKPEIVQSANVFSWGAALTDGEHTLKVRVRDELGNWSAYSELSKVVVDHTPPGNPVINSPTPTRDRTPMWSWTSTGDPVEYGVTFGAAAEIMQASSSFTASADLPDGDYTLKVRARDALGNWSDTTADIVTVYCIPSEGYINFVVGSSGQTFAFARGTSSCNIAMPGEGLVNTVVGINPSEWIGGVAMQIIDVYLEGFAPENHLGVFVLGNIGAPSSPTELYLKKDGHCYVAELGDNSKDSSGEYAINFTKITT